MRATHFYQVKLESQLYVCLFIIVYAVSQAQIVSRKKEAAAEALNDARNELHSLKAELAEKQQQLRDSDNQGMLKPDEVGQQGSSKDLDLDSLNPWVKHQTNEAC